jgi:putative methyltransferase (TIGR04325 family)
MASRLIANFYKLINGYNSFNDRVSSWEQAKNITTGYQTNEILNKVKTTFIESRNKMNAYERDSVLFQDGALNWPLIAMIYWTSQNVSDDVKVMDFGGSFASQYFQNEKLLDKVRVKWSVVEQNHFAYEAKKIINHTNINFYYQLEECLNLENPNLALFGSSLQYLEYPYTTLMELKNHNIKVLILDRIPTHPGLEDIVIAQKVDKSIYDASYPAWIFSEKKLNNFISNDWILINSHLGIGGKQKTRRGIHFEWKSYIYLKRTINESNSNRN